MPAFKRHVKISSVASFSVHSAGYDFLQNLIDVWLAIRLFSRDIKGPKKLESKEVMDDIVV
jgi:hypothetical protein